MKLYSDFAWRPQGSPWTQNSQYASIHCQHAQFNLNRSAVHSINFTIKEFIQHIIACTSRPSRCGLIDVNKTKYTANSLLLYDQKPEKSTAAQNTRSPKTWTFNNSSSTLFLFPRQIQSFPVSCHALCLQASAHINEPILSIGTRECTNPL